MDQYTREQLTFQINKLVDVCHSASKNGGWWTDPSTGEDLLLTVERALSKLALVHSEVSEATEGFRKDQMDDHLKHRKMAEVELADAVIRICDLAGKAGFDLGGAVIEKLDYNQFREDHKLENRQKEGGKKA